MIVRNYAGRYLNEFPHIDGSYEAADHLVLAHGVTPGDGLLYRDLIRLHHEAHVRGEFKDERRLHFHKGRD